MRPLILGLAAALVAVLLLGRPAAAQEAVPFDIVASHPGAALPAAPVAGPIPLAPTVLPGPPPGEPVVAAPAEAACSPDASGLWASVDALLWWVSGQRLPPLATTSRATGPTAGFLGQRGTTIVLGDSRVNGQPQAGMAFTVGGWLDSGHILGIQASYFLVNGQAINQRADTGGNPPLFRPFFDLGTGQPAAAPVATTGGVSTQVFTRGLQGASFLVRLNPQGVGTAERPWWFRLGLTGGYSYLGLAESLYIRGDIPPASRGGQAPVALDLFRTRDEFHGGQVGLLAEWDLGRLTAQAEAALAVGTTTQTALLDGPTTGARLPAGLLVQPGNAGLYHHDAVSVVPRWGLKVGWRLTPWAQMTVGYSGLAWTRVARVGDQVSLAINPGAAPAGQPAPRFTFHDSILWAQGLDLGLALSY